MRSIIFGLASILTLTPTTDVYEGENYNLASDNAITDYEIIQFDNSNYGEGTKLYAFNVGEYNRTRGDSFQIQLSGYFNTDNNETEYTKIPYDIISSTTQMTNNELYTYLERLAEDSSFHFDNEFSTLDYINEVITYENLSNNATIYFYLLVPYELYDTNNSIFIEPNNTYLTSNSMSFNSDSNPNMSYTIAERNGYYNGYTTGYQEGYAKGANDTYQGAYDEGYNRGYNWGRQEGYVEGYDEGYDYGKTQNYEDGYNDGYDIGNTEGYNRGYNIGYDEGYRLADTSETNLANLMLIIATTPFETFKTIWNFDILGFNLATFTLGLLTLGIVLIIWKKIR